MAKLTTTKVDLSGLLTVLSKNLYSTPSIAIRELVQNAHDACVRDQVELNGQKQYRIDIECHPQKGELVITDNGSGLTYEEIEKYLATIGSGYTRQLRGQVDNEEMIGYYGLGFLSAYVVADKVEVITASSKTPDNVWLFSSNGGHRFSIDQSSAQLQGTRVKLILKEDYRHLADEEVIRKLLLKYCSLLPIEIFINKAEHALNREVPWRKSLSALQEKKQSLAFADLFENQFSPMCVITIPENEYKVEGIFWVQDGGSYASSDNRNVNVFVRNMFISDEVTDLLPRWAGFIGCVVNTPLLTPTASREDIQKDEVYSDIQNFLANTLVDGLKSIAKHETENWQRVLTRHSEALLGAAMSSDELFFETADQLPVPTSLGKMTIPAIAKLSDNRICIHTEGENFSYQTMLFKAQMLPVVSGHLFAASSYCLKYEKLIGGIKTLIIGNKSDNEKFFAPVDIALNEKEVLSGLFQKKQEELVFTSFAPDFIPLVLVDNHEAKIKKSIEADEANKRIGNAILSLARKTTETIDGSVERYVYINMQNSLIQSIGNLETEKAKTLANMLRSYVVTLGRQNVETDFTSEIKNFFQQLNKVIN